MIHYTAILQHCWVVLIAVSPGAIIRAVRLPNRYVTPDVRRDFLTPRAWIRYSERSSMWRPLKGSLRRLTSHHSNSSSMAFASFKSVVLNPSENHP